MRERTRMRMRTSIFLTLVIMGLVSIGTIGTVSAAVSNSVYVDPPEVTGVYIGESFTVVVNATDVALVNSYEIRLDYNTTILDCTDVVVGDFITGMTLPFQTIDDPGGKVTFGVLNLDPLAYVNGSGVLGTINFTVTGVGSSALDIGLWDSGPGEPHNWLLDTGSLQIQHNSFNGSFSLPRNILMFEAIAGCQTYYVSIETNSSISNFFFDQTYSNPPRVGETSFDVAPARVVYAGTTGFCNVTIPKNLTTGSPWFIREGGAAVPQFDQSENATHTSLYFEYTHGASPSLVQIYGTWMPSVWTFEAVAGGQTYYVSIETNSSISNCFFNETYSAPPQEGETSFDVAGPDGTTGFCNVTIPKNLTTGLPWFIREGGAAVPQFDQSENATHTSLYFEYTHGASPSLVQIYGTWVVPEFSGAALVLMLLVSATLVAVAFRKKLRSSSKRSPA